MAYDLSFSADFFISDDEFSSDKPFTVQQAIAAMTDEEYAEMSRAVFDCEPTYVDQDTVLEKIQETNTCGDLRPPVEVWIDPEGCFTVKVHEAPRHIPDLENNNLPLCGNETQGETVAWIDRNFVANCGACKALLKEGE